MVGNGKTTLMVVAMMECHVSQSYLIVEHSTGCLFALVINRVIFYYPAGYTEYFGLTFYSISEMKIRFLDVSCQTDLKQYFSFSKQSFNESLDFCNRS